MTRLAALLRGAMLAVFFVSTLALSFSQPGLFVSPDEHANFLFAQALAETGRLCIPEGLNAELGGMLHPRSAVAVGACIVPGSFLGLPIMAGILGMIAGDVGIVLFTPLAATFALAALWSVLRRVFPKTYVADLAVLLLAVHPAFWHYTARAMMHNVAFTSFLVFAVWLALRRTPLMLMLAGVSVGVALFFRTSEAAWVLAVSAGALLYFRRTIGWRSMLAFVGGAAVMGAVIGAANAWVYGAPWVTGYLVHETPIGEVIEGAAVASSASSSAGPSLWSTVGRGLFPFGIHEFATLRNVWQYGVLLYPALTGIAAVGAVVALTDRKLRRFALATIALSVWLGVVYGSWSFADNPDPRAITIGNSHVRYWIPLFVLGAIFAGIALDRAVRFVRAKMGPQIAWGALAIVLVAIVSASARFVLVENDGVFPSMAALDSFAQKRDVVVARTEEDAIVIVDRADKYLFPDRRVVVPLREERTYSAMPVLVDAAPLYYFGLTLPDVDIAHLNDEKLAALGLRIDLVVTIDNETLYRISEL